MTAVWPAPDTAAAVPAGLPARRPRVDGVDLARGLAIAGMLVAHFAARDRPGVLDSVRAFVDGRAMPLFVVLAGVSITLLARSARHPDRALLVRALVFLPLGLALQEWTRGIAIILQYYAVFFVAAVGLRRLGDRALLAVAVATGALAGVTQQLLGPRWPGYVAWEGGDGLVPPWGLLANLTVNGYYPFLPAGAFLCVGLWLGRRDLADRRLAVRLVVVGVVLALAGSVGGRAIGDRLGADGLTTGADGRLTWRSDRLDQITDVLGDDLRSLEVNLVNDPALRRQQLLATLAYAEDRSPAFHVARLFDASGHSEMPAWVLGATGSSLAGLGLCVLVAGRARRAVAALVALGQVSLTAYVVQALVIRWTPTHDETSIGAEFAITGALLVALALFAWLWRRRFRRGPLEAALHAVARS